MEKKEILLKLRQETGMNRREFAEYFGIPYRTVQEWELGHREMPGYLLRLMYYHEKTKEKEQLLPKMQSEDGKISIVRDVDGKNIVIINDIRFRGKRKIKWDEVEKYLREYVKKYYEIEAYSDKIYIGKDFPDEFAHSRDSEKLSGANTKAKANAAQAIGELKIMRISMEPGHKTDGIVTMSDLEFLFMTRMKIWNGTIFIRQKC